MVTNDTRKKTQYTDIGRVKGRQQVLLWYLENGVESEESKIDMIVHICNPGI